MDDDLDPLTPDLHGLLDDGPPVAAGVDALRQVVARRDRARLRTLGVGLAVALIAGPAAGYALGQSNGSSSTPVASAATSKAADHGVVPSAAGAPSVESGGSGTEVTPAIVGGSPGNLPKPTQLFLRNTSDGIRIRAYLQSSPAPIAVGVPNCITKTPTGTVPCPRLPTCLPQGSSLDAQVSNDQVAGQVMGEVLSSGTGPLDVAEAMVVGPDDPTPIGTVLVHAGPGVATVRLTVPGGGTDEMAPVQGDAVLARDLTGLTPGPFPSVVEPLPAQPGPPVSPGAPASPPSPASPPNAAPATTGLETAPAIAGFKRPVGYGFPANSRVEALDGSGKVLDTLTLPGIDQISGGSIACGPIPYPGGPVPPPGASGGSSGSSGGGVVSGGAVSGSGTAEPATSTTNG